jgi:hypothetical protein
MHLGMHHTPSGTDFVRLIVCTPCSNDGVETTSYLKEECSTLLRNRWNLILVRSLLVVIFLVSCVEKIVGKKMMAVLALSIPQRRLVQLI